MDEKEKRLQEKLEELEAGQPLAAVLAGLDPEETAAVLLAAQFRGIPVPNRDPDLVQTQRMQVIQQAQQIINDRERKMDHKTNWIKWLVPAAVLLFVCAVTMVAISGTAGFFFWQRARVADVPADAPGTEVLQAPPESSGEFSQVPAVPEVSQVEAARMAKVQGTVQVMGADGTWARVTEGLVGAGQRLRTGALSSVQLRFFDGSRVYVAANTEIYLKRSGLQKDGARVVMIEQFSGETTHNVIPAAHSNAYYAVSTPVGNGYVRGTSFDVVVDRDQSAQFYVYEGQVAVTNQGDMVAVNAGQVATVSADVPLEDPVFYFLGEGELTAQVGETWTIAGQEFLVTAEAEVVGEPAVGDWVFVRGRLLADNTRAADYIVKIRSDFKNNFSMTGTADTIGADQWVVSGTAILVDQYTDITEGINPGDPVYVEGIIQETGEYLASKIRLIEPDGQPFEFTGVVESMAPAGWTVSGVEVAVDSETEIEPGIAADDLVRVEGRVMPDGTWLALEIKKETVERKFEFTGTVDSVAPWSVSGISFETDGLTEIEEGVVVGVLVKVEGQIMEDGTWLANEITLVDDTAAATMVLIGLIDTIEPWVVSGVSLNVDDFTDIEPGLEPGDLVRVDLILTEAGTWVAARIALVTWTTGVGCMEYSDLVVARDETSFTLNSGLTLLFDEVTLYGDLQVNSVVLLSVCYDENSQPELIIVTVLFQLEPPVVAEPTPTPVSTEPEEPGEEPTADKKVQICHKPSKAKGGHTITVAEPAVPAHLGHGDILGPCP